MKLNRIKLTPPLAAVVVSLGMAASASAESTSLSYVQDGLIAQWDGIENAGRGRHDPNAAYPVELVSGIEQTLTGEMPAHDSWFEFGKGALSFVSEDIQTAINEGHVTIELVVANNGSYVNNGGLIGFGTETRGFWAYQQSTLLTACSYHARANGEYQNINYNATGTNTVCFVLGDTAANSWYGADGVRKAGLSRWSTDMATADCKLGAIGSYGWANVKVFSIRVYNRVLTEQELQHNRRIDKDRFLYLNRKTVYVSPTGSDTTGDGTEGKPFGTVVKGVNSCVDGDTLVLLKGRHDNSYGATEIAKDIVIRGETDDPWDTVINMDNGAGPAFALKHQDMLVCNLAVTNAGGSYAMGSAFKIVGDGGTVSNCVMWRCNSGGWNVGSAAYGASAKALYTHCVLSNCVMSSSNGKGAGGMILTSGARATKILIADCSANAVDDDSGAGGVRCDNGYLTDCTIVGCSGKRTGGLTLKAGSAVNCIIAGNVSLNAGAAYNEVHPSDLARVTDSASASDSGLDDTCVLDLPVNFFRNLLTHDYRPAAQLPVSYGFYPVDTTEPKVTMKLSAVKGLAPQAVDFKAAVDGFAAGDDVTYSWDFGSGTSPATDAAETSATFGAGTHDVSLTVVNATTGKTYRDVKVGVLSVGPRDVYVKYGNKTSESPYADEATAAAKIADALVVAVEGTTIHLLEGTYGAGATVGKSVIFVGDNADPEKVILNKTLTINASGVSLSGVTFSDAAAAIYVTGSNASISNCVVRNCANSGPSAAAPVCLLGAGGLVTHCVITNNSNSPSYTDYSDWRGAGGLYINGGTVAETLIAGNRMPVAYGDGNNDKCCQAGGAALGGGARMVNCTVVNNMSNAKRTPVGGVRVVSGTVVNSIIAKNAVGDYGSADCANTMPSDEAKFSSCAVTDDAAIFENLAAGKYGPSDDARVFDAGAARADAPAKDLGGNDRIQGAAIDLGCYERDPSKFTVSFTADKEAALAPAAFTLTASYAVPAGDTVVYDWELRNGETVITRSVTNDAHLDVTLETCGAWDVALRVVNETTQAAASVEGAAFLKVDPRTLFVRAGNEDAAYPYDDPVKGAATLVDAIAAAGVGSVVRLAGTVQGDVTVAKRVSIVGDGADPEDSRIKGLLTVTAGDVLLSGLTFEGGGRYVETEGPGLTMTNCIVRGGSGWWSAVRITGTGALVTHCVMTNNETTSTYYGNWEAPPALYLKDGTVKDSLFWKNTFTVDGAEQSGAVGLYGSSSMINCTVVDNEGSTVGGVVIRDGTVVNSIIVANRQRSGSAENANINIEKIGSCSTTVVSDDTSVFEDFAVGKLGPSASPLVYDAGAERPDAPSVDLAGAPRIQGAAIDLGCYERDPSKFTVSFAAEKTVLAAPSSFVLHASCLIPEDHCATYAWRITQGGTTVSVDKTDDPDVTVSLSAYGEWDVSLVVTDTTSGNSASSEVASYLKLVPATVYAKAGNENAAAPYETEETAAATIADACSWAVADGQQIVLLPGVYTNNGATVSVGVTLRGQTGNPEDVIVRKGKVSLGHAGAMVCGMVFEGQSLSSGGAAVEVSASGGIVSNCVFRNMSGGSFYSMAPLQMSGANAFATHCVFTNNTPKPPEKQACAGGAILLAGARIENCLIADNRQDESSAESAPGVYANPGLVVNCTVVRNVSGKVAGVHMANTSSAGARRVVNTVMAGNVSRNGSGNIEQAQKAYYDHCVVDETIVNAPGLVKATWEEMFGGSKPGKPYMPRVKGPLFNKGDNTAIRDATDLLGNPRCVGRAVDIGAFEAPPLGLSILVR